MARQPNTNCSECGKPIYRKPYFLKRTKTIACDKCRPVVFKRIAHKEQRRRYEAYVKRWKDGHENGMKGKTSTSAHIRRYLFEQSDSKCQQCGWGEVNTFTGKVPLQINHIDGDFRNNKEGNLELICPNCHTLTENYGSRNRGRGRPGRKIGG